ANDQAPLTSRTVRFISQSTVTQREVESDPNITDPNSTVRGPGFVAPVGVGGHFPPGVPFTPQVDLFGIEDTNRDRTSPITGTRFNIPPPDLAPGVQLYAPESYGVASGKLTSAQSRGVATLPGGVPIFEK